MVVRREMAFGGGGGVKLRMQGRIRRVTERTKRRKRARSAMEVRNAAVGVGVGKKANCRVLVAVANGTEEMECVIVSDVLRRAKIDVVIASVEPSRSICASRGVTIVADVLLEEVADEEFDAVVVPGGMPGAEALRDSDAMRRVLEAAAKRNAIIAAICAAPAVVLQPMGLLDGARATCHPAFASKLPSCEDVAVVEDGARITSRGPGTAFAFALAIVRRLAGEDVADEVAAPMCLNYSSFP